MLRCNVISNPNSYTFVEATDVSFVQGGTSPTSFNFREKQMGAANQMSCWIAGGFDISIIREKTPQRFVGISLEKMVSFIAFRIGYIVYNWTLCGNNDQLR